MGGLERDDLYDVPYGGGTGKMACGSDSSIYEEQSGQKSPPSTPPTSVANDESERPSEVGKKESVLKGPVRKRGPVYYRYATAP